MSNLNEDTVRRALTTVPDPKGGSNVVDAGMVQGIFIDKGLVRFALVVSPDAGRDLETLRVACERAVSQISGVDSATAVLTAERVTEKPEPLKRPPPLDPGKSSDSGINKVDAIIAVASGKGGVGKSTVAVNLALALKAQGLAVGLMDADIYGPSVPRMMGLSGKPESTGKTIFPIEGHGIPCMSMGSMVEDSTAMIWRGPMVIKAIQQMLNDVEWGPLDILVLDLPPGTGDAQLTIAQSVPLKGAVIVSTPQDIALLDAKRGIAMFDKVKVPTLGIVENMSTFICPYCGEESHIFGHGGARETAEAFNVDFLGEIPLHLSIRETSDAGTPIVVSDPESAEAAAFFAIAQKLAVKISSEVTPTAPSIRFD